MTTISDIRNELINVFNGLRDGSIEAKDAMEINNTAGKIISTAKVQIAYHALRNEAPEIAFLAAPVAPQPRDEPLPSPDNTNPKAGAPEHG
ncbi:MAG TPA: hypothetical protein VM471_09485 [Phenylobacterium sp.]|jgi:hypothetical protein|nr:hypothetical protein [Phenylobacterium sp.]